MRSLDSELQAQESFANSLAANLSYENKGWGVKSPVHYFLLKGEVMYEQLYEEFKDLIELIFVNEIEPAELASKITVTKKLTYDEKVEWLDKLGEYCDNNYANPEDETPADVVQDIAAYFQVTVGSEYTNFGDNENEKYAYKVTDYDRYGKLINLEYYKTLEEAFEYVPEQGIGIIRKVLAVKENDKIIDFKSVLNLANRFVYSEGKWIFDCPGCV